MFQSKTFWHQEAVGEARKSKHWGVGRGQEEEAQPEVRKGWLEAHRSLGQKPLTPPEGLSWPPQEKSSDLVSKTPGGIARAGERMRCPLFLPSQPHFWKESPYRSPTPLSPKFLKLPLGTSLVAQMLKNLSAMQETWVWSLGWEDSLEKGMAAHSSALARRIPWTFELGGLQSMGSQRVGHDWATYTFTFNSAPANYEARCTTGMWGTLLKDWWAGEEQFLTLQRQPQLGNVSTQEPVVTGFIHALLHLSFRWVLSTSLALC